MDVISLIMILLVSFNLAVMVTKGWGNHFPQPNLKARHQHWLVSWQNTANKPLRLWLQTGITLFISLLFFVADFPFVAVLVLLRAVLFLVAGIEAIKYANANKVAAPTQPAAPPASPPAPQA